MPSVCSVLLSSRSEHPRLCFAQHTGTHSVLLAHRCAPSTGQPGRCEVWPGASWAARIAAESSAGLSVPRRLDRAPCAYRI